jgi:hypothetical protein
MKSDKLSNFLPVCRTLFNHPFWKEKREFSKLEAWLDLIVSARFEETETTELIDGKMISWTRGQLPASIRYLAQRWQWGNTKVSNFLRLLEKEQMIDRLSVKGQTILLLKNYENYNGRHRHGQSNELAVCNTEIPEDSAKDGQKTTRRRTRDKLKKDNKEDNLYGAYSQEDITMFVSFQDWIQKNTPRVAKMKQPFAISEYTELRKLLSKEIVKDLLFAMENYAQLITKNQSAFLTITSWAKTRGYILTKTINSATSEYLRKREDAAEQVRKRAQD